MIIGITGSIATGKTHVEKMIKARGYQVVDADYIAHQALYRKTEGYKKTVSAFGTTILNKNQSINRRKLGQIVFLNPDKKRLLENLVHPFVIDKIKQMILKKGQKELLFISVPLLYEVEMEFLFDYIIVVYVSQAKQIERLMNRDHINRDLALLKIASQMPLEVKKRKADFVIDNEADGQTQLAKQIEKILQEIKEKANEI
ncbi:MAG: dephospho-CoA kinase [Bacilli bacterium]|nr:dephospho-CoA kinase [Bacilli bacterium]MDD3348270.1 dephospho-CoA kinase [Bacilli bacterium]MDD4056384.1 dephospho-CoA kinase [Bacilli bacterium]MDY0209066.1 dephospho-CoA kinase [Bacilli bacterium]